LRGNGPLTKSLPDAGDYIAFGVYVIAVYFGAVSIRKTRHAVPAGLIAVWTVRLLFQG
jgi:spore maturation protein SpmB